MTIFELLLYICLLFSVFKKTRNSNILIVFLLCIMVGIAAFRSIDIGVDTIHYYEDYLFAVSMHSLSDKQAGELLFAFMTYVFRNYLNYDWYMLFWYSCIIFSAGFVIIKSSKNKFLSLFLFIACCFYTNSLNVMRQFVSSFLMFIAMYEYTKENFNKYKIMLICVVCYFIHNSSLILWPLFFVKKMDMSKILQLSLVLGSFVLGFFLTRYLYVIFEILSTYAGRFGGYLLYEGDGERNFISNLGVNIMFIATLFIASPNTIKTVYFKAYFISMVLFNIVGSMYYLTRITDLYAIAQIICLPTAIYEYKNRTGKYIYILLLISYALSRFYIKGLYPFLPYDFRDNINLFSF